MKSKIVLLGITILLAFGCKDLDNEAKEGEANRSSPSGKGEHSMKQAESRDFTDPEVVSSLNKRIGYELYGVAVFGSETGRRSIDIYRDYGIDSAIEKILSSEGEEQFRLAFNGFLEADPYFDRINGCLIGVINTLKNNKDGAVTEELDQRLQTIQIEIVSLIRRVLELPANDFNNTVKFMVLKACHSGTYHSKNIDTMNRDLANQIDILE